MNVETRMNGSRRVRVGASIQRIGRIAFTALLGSLSVAPMTALADELPAEAKDWKAVGEGTDLMSGTKYSLENQTIKKNLVYGPRGSFGGINLKWATPPNRARASFHTQAGSGPIKYGDKVALMIDGIDTPYLRYEKRPLGINLKWAKNGVFEWVIVGGVEGEPVHVGEPFALVNLVEKDFLIYAEREAGVINLRWYLNRKKGGYLDRAKRFVARHPEIAKYVIEAAASS